MKALVLGGCGFIGQHVCKALSASHIPVVVFDGHAVPADSTPGCTFVRGSFSDASQIEAVIGHFGITHVVHLISTTLPKSSNEDKAYDISSNVIQTVRLLDLCVKYKVRKVLFMSSGGTIYGAPSQVPVDEKHPNHPICSYGISKLAIEKYLYLYHHLHELDYVCLRAANPYGPGQNPRTGQGIIAHFIHKMHVGQPLEVWGDGHTVRDYFHVRDLARLTTTALLSKEVGVFNAGSGTGLSINGLIATLQDVLGLPCEVIYKPSRGLDVPAIVLDSSAALARFGWRASTTLEEGIMDYAQWHLSMHGQQTDSLLAAAH